MNTSSSDRISDEQVLARVESVVWHTRRLTAELLVLLHDVEERRLYLLAACPSLYEYCIRRLDMSEGAAYRRITAARLVARFPKLLPYVECGDLHLSALVQIRDFVTDENVDELAAATRGKSKYGIAKMLAARAPRPDVPSRMRKLPQGRKKSSLSTASAAEKGDVAPLAESRYRLQVTVSRQVRDDIERILDLTMHSNPQRDLEAVIELAIGALLDKVEKQRLGNTSRCDAAERSPKTDSDEIPRAVRRRVFERDGAQCTFVNEAGERCPAKTFLEIDHIEPRARGGTNDEANLRVRCGPHNRLHAEQTFGKAFVRSRILQRQLTRVAARLRPRASMP